MMKTIVKILLAAIVLSLAPTTYVCAQGNIETPAERKAREAREAEAKRKKQQQDAAARRQREEEARKKREAEEQAAREQAAREQAEREQAAREEAERKRREAEEEERLRPIRELEANMVRVEGGTFTMGATKEQKKDADDDEKPSHQVTLSSFYLCKYEVTQELWQAVMGTNPSMFKGAKRPVEQVSWEDCQRFITMLNQMTGKNYRLPTEAEWEYAARGGNRSNGYKYAGGNSIGDVAWYNGNSGSTTHDVGTKHANELGLYDMAGNVFEWCSDWYSRYSSSSQTNPSGPSSICSYRVRRGGSWLNDSKFSRVSYRGSAPTWRSDHLGLRLAL